MNKTELVGRVSKKSGLSKKDSAKAIEATFGEIKEALSKGEGVSLIGFGSFEVHKREARKGRNPRTGAELRIAAHKVSVFRPGKALKDAVNKK